VEDYVAQHTGVQFSHGICPTCYENVMEAMDRRAAQAT
jgi:hypothetical protein